MKITAYRRTVAAMLIGFGIVLLVVACRQFSTQRGHLAVSQIKGVATASAPSDRKIPQAEKDAYTVRADVPKYLTIPSLKISKARVKSLGIVHDRIADPDNIYDVGWYKASAKLGEAGAVFMYGHVSNWNANGVFYDLKKLKPGDAVTVTRGDNHEFTYNVVATETYPASSVPMDKVLAPIVAGGQGLNLMTCTGKVVEGTSDFTDRLVVYTSLVKN